jgi:hypothetical protein
MQKKHWMPALVLGAVIGVMGALALGAEEKSPGCGGYKTPATCNADLRCMWYGPYCGQRLE